MDKERELLIKIFEKAGQYISCNHCAHRKIDNENKVINCRRDVPALDNVMCLIKKLFYFDLPKEPVNAISEKEIARSLDIDYTGTNGSEKIAEEVTGRPEEKPIVGY